MLLTSIISNTIAQTTHTVSISIAAASGKEGNSGETFKTVTGNLSQTYTQQLSVSLCYSGSAAYNSDFQITSFFTDTPLPSFSVKDCRDFSFSTGSTSFRFRIKVLGDALDEPDETVILSLQNLKINSGADPAPAGIVVSSTAGSVTFTIEDDDPTIVSLARTGSTGAVSEGQMVEFTVTLERSLIAGEIIDVPLAVGGTGVTTADWNLATKSGTGLNTGVTLSGADTTTPQVRFSGADADTATLVLRTVDDDTSEKVETLTLALGPDGTGNNGFDLASRMTNVGGGANPHPTNNSFTLTVNNINPPAAPTGLTATAGSGQVTLSWTAPNNSTISGYQYRQKAGSGSFGSWTDIPNSDAKTTHTVTGLTVGTEYTFEVRAVAGTANGPSSNQVMATPFLAAPTGLTATAGDGQVTLSWTDPNNSTITRYQFQQKAGTSDYSSWTTISGSTAATTTHTIARLTNGTSYTLRIRAQAGTVSGRPSNEVMATPQTPMIEVTAGTAVTEGMAAAFTITANPPPASNLSVNLAVTETAGSNFIASGSEGAKRVMISNSGSATYTVATEDDDVDEPDGGVSVTIESGFGYAVGGISSAMVQVKDDDAAPMITSPAAVSIAENTIDVLTVTATDADAGTTLIYTITGGADSARFSLDQNTGDLAFKTAPDFEAPSSADNDNIYEVEVTASDGTNSTAQTITIMVTNENDNNPMITSPATASIVENTTTVLTVTATDADAGTTLIYSISGGADRALFNINRTSGALTFITVPDFEGSSADGDDDYEVTVTVSDGTNSVTQTIIVTVSNDPADDILSFSEAEEATVIFPNPSDRYLEVRSPVRGTFKIVSLSGKPLLEGPTNTKVDISSLQSGLYLVQLPDGRLLKFVRE